MYIYNVTTQVSGPIHEAWLEWMKSEHIPKVLATGCFTDSRLLRLLEIDETQGPTYAVQYLAESYDKYQQYITHFAPALRQEVYQKWGDQVIAFRTLMQEVG